MLTNKYACTATSVYMGYMWGNLSERDGEDDEPDARVEGPVQPHLVCVVLVQHQNTHTCNVNTNNLLHHVHSHTVSTL